MSKYSHMIVSDKDGTLLINKSVNNILAYAGKHNCLFVMASGRTIADTNEIFKKAGVGIPHFTIGDNGAIVYDNKSHKTIQRFNLKDDVIYKIIEKYFELGGKPQDLRYTNGENIFALNNPLNHNYYKNTSTIEYLNNISNIEDITKITLAGSKELMQNMADFATQLDCTSDIGQTGFPSKLFNYYRLDVQDKNATKGNAVTSLANHLGIKNFSCFGNGWNDLSMFKTALSSGNNAFVMSNAPQDLLIELHNYIKTLDTKSRGKLNMIYSDDSRDTIQKHIHDCVASRKNPPSFRDSIKPSGQFTKLKFNDVKNSTFSKEDKSH